MNRGQGAIMDALFFLLICAVSSTLLFYVSSIYGQGIDQQISSIYNLEYTGNALVALQSHNDHHFWYDLRKRVMDAGEYEENEVEEYIDDEEVWEDVEASSPSPYPFLCFEGCDNADGYCYPSEGSDYAYEIENEYLDETHFQEEGYVAYTSSVVLETGCEAVFKVYY